MQRRSQALRLIGVAVGVAVVAAFLATRVSALDIRVYFSVRANSGGVVTIRAGDRFSCPPKCVLTMRLGAAVGLIATPAPGHVFVRWAGGCVGTAPRCLIVAGMVNVVRAVFALTRRAAAAGRRAGGLAEVNVTVSGPGTVIGGPNDQITCGGASVLAHGCHGSFARGTTLTLHARPNSGHGFYRWVAQTCSKQLRCQLRVSGSTLVIAAFRP